MQYATRTKNSEQLLIRVTAELRKDVEAAAIDDDISISEFLRRAITTYLELRKEEKSGKTSTDNYKEDILKSLEDEEFRIALLKKLNGE